VAIRNIRSLNLRKIKITNKGIRILANSLPTSIEELNLSENNFGVEGTQIITPCIANMSHLRILDFSINKINEGALDLAKALDNKPLMCTLVLCNNGIDDISMK